MENSSRKNFVKQIKQDMEEEWWKASDTDQFSLKEKMLRVGCRPLKRKYLACRTMAPNTEESFGECRVSNLLTLKTIPSFCVMSMSIEDSK